MAAYAASKADAEAADLDAAAAYAAAVDRLRAELVAYATATRGRRSPPPAGTTYTLSRGRYHEMGGGGMVRRAAVAHRAAAVQQIRMAVQSGGVASAGPADVTPEAVAAHDSVRSGDTAVVLAATRQWMASRRQALYRAVWRSQATAGTRKARVHQVIQRHSMAATVARELTGGYLRRVIRGTAVVVVMGDAATRGGATWLRKHLRRLCWLVDMPEHNSSQACGRCHKKLAIVFPTAAAAPRVPRGSLICGRRRGTAGRRGRPAAPIRGFWIRTTPRRYGRRRAACRAEAANKAATALVKNPPSSASVYRDPSRSGLWGVRSCEEHGLVNRDTNAAMNMGWKLIQQMRQRSCFPFYGRQRVPKPGARRGRGPAAGGSGQGTPTA